MANIAWVNIDTVPKVMLVIYNVYVNESNNQNNVSYMTYIQELASYQSHSAWECCDKVPYCCSFHETTEQRLCWYFMLSLEAGLSYYTLK